MAHSWDPDRYLWYADERGRPFHDLLARVGATAPDRVVDLGCGPGNLTRLLAERWPGAGVVGVDSSEDMIDRARRDGAGPSFEVADLRTWEPAAPADVVVANAVLQWLPGHLDLLPRLVGMLGAGGWLALQVPGNFEEPSHTIRTELASRPPYAEHLRDVAVPASADPEDYLLALAALGCEVDVWETTYTHVLTGEDPVFAWVAGTGARPTLQALPDDLRQAFADELRARLAEAYPAGPYGVLLPFRRVFAVARLR